VSRWVPALSVIPWAELPQPVTERPPLPSAVAVVPLIWTSMGMPSMARRPGSHHRRMVAGVPCGATPDADLGQPDGSVFWRSEM